MCGRFTQTRPLEDFIEPLCAYPVSPQVNSSEFNSPECIAEFREPPPEPPAPSPQMELF